MKNPLMRSTLAAGTLFVFLLVGCASPSGSKAASPGTINDASLRSTFDINAAELIENGGFTSKEKLLAQLSRTSCQLELPEPGKKQLTPAEIYQQRLGSVVIVGTLRRCHNPKCGKIHSNLSSGVVIKNDGIVLTNYHVVASETEHSITMAVMTIDGKSFLVDEVLAANEAADVAILRLKDAKDLVAAPLYLDESVGAPATINSHPAGKFFTLTHGVVSRYSLGKNGERIMNVTADYARGSSGGPIFNDRGDVIGLVANTQSITYRNVPLAFDEDSDALVKVPKKEISEFGGVPLSMGLNHQLTFKNAVSSYEIFKLIKE
jgi:S1-C subfamily serine protease